MAAGVALVSNGTPAPARDPLPSEADMPAVTTVLDRDGNPIAQLDDQYRIPVAIDAIAPAMQAAAVAIEDRRFYDEAGVDPIGTVRALVSNSLGSATQGGSTITQQYVKNYLINVVDRENPAAQRADRSDTLGRKVREAELATGLAHTMSKNDVLDGYLNVVEFSGNVYGVEAAARAYFGTTAAALTVPQAALLAGMVNNPNLYDPYDHPQQAKDRRDVVIAAMAQVGSITPAQAAAATAAPLDVRPDGPVVPGGTCMAAAPDAGFFCQYAVDYLEKGGMTADRLATGGYTIRTTMDPAASAAAKAAAEANVPTRQNGVANTFAIVRPGHDGHEVVAMVANRNYGTDAAQGERATDIVADPSNVFGAGSSFKIFTTAAAWRTAPWASTRRCRTPAPTASPRRTPTATPPAIRWPTTGPATRTRSASRTRWPRRRTWRSSGWSPAPGCRRCSPWLGGSACASPWPATTPEAPRHRPGRPAVEEPPVRPAAVAVLPEPALVHPRGQPGQHAGDGQRRRDHRERRHVVPAEPDPSVTDRDGHPVAVPQQACEQVVAPGLAHTLAAGLSQDTISGTSAAAARDAGWTRPDIGKTGTTNASESSPTSSASAGPPGTPRVDGLCRRHPPAGVSRDPRPPRPNCRHARVRWRGSRSTVLRPRSAAPRRHPGHPRAQPGPRLPARRPRV